MMLSLSVLSIVADWIRGKIGVLSWIPGSVWLVQVLLSGFILLLMFAGVLLLPGRLLKLLSLIVGVGMVIFVWFV